MCIDHNSREVGKKKKKSEIYGSFSERAESLKMPTQKQESTHSGSIKSPLFLSYDCWSAKTHCWFIRDGEPCNAYPGN